MKIQYDFIEKRIIMPLTIEQKEKIANKAKSIWEENRINLFNFDVLRFITTIYDFKIQSRRFANQQITGMLLVDEDVPIELNENVSTNRLIAISSNVVNGQDGCERTCFIALHELWHYIHNCEENKIRQFATRDTGKKETIEEQEADYFALCMLMPEDLIRKHITLCEGKIERIQATQRIFGVTRKKAILRLEELGLIGEQAEYGQG